MKQMHRYDVDGHVCRAHLPVSLTPESEGPFSNSRNVALVVHAFMQDADDLNAVIRETVEKDVGT